MTEPYLRLEGLVARIAYPGLRWEVLREAEVSLRVVADETTDSRTGEPTSWKGRKWRLSYHMTDGEVVQTAFLALMTALEHEARERFTFDGISVFDPHYDIHKLVALRREASALMERA